jgi:hypothetical protein
LPQFLKFRCNSPLFANPVAFQHQKKVRLGLKYLSSAGVLAERRITIPRYEEISYGQRYDPFSGRDRLR